MNVNLLGEVLLGLQHVKGRSLFLVLIPKQNRPALCGPAVVIVRLFCCLSLALQQAENVLFRRVGLSEHRG